MQFSKNIFLHLWVDFCKYSQTLHYMERTKEEILNEISTMLADIRKRTELIENALAELLAADGNTQEATQSPASEIPPVALEDIAIDVWPDDIDLVQPAAAVVATAVETAVEVPSVDSIPDIPDMSEFIDGPVAVEEPAPVEETPVAEEPVIVEDPFIVEEPAVVEETPIVDEPVIIDEPVIVEKTPVVEETPVVDEPAVVDEPETDIFGAPVTATVNDRQRGKQKKSVMDVMEKVEAWRTDMPGTPVKDIRSAISLNDRILFIRTLFDEDAEKFQEAISAINAFASFDEAVGFVKERFAAWNFGSDTVYRFMMAVRRKLK